MIKNTNEKINTPNLNDVVFFQPWITEADKHKRPYPVLIISGCFFDSSFRVGNFWNWQPLTLTGKNFGEVRSGYGNFTKATGWKIEVKVKVS